MLNIVVGEGGTHQYAHGITAGEVIRNVHGRKSGAVAALVDGIERDMSHELADGQTIEPILGESDADCTFSAIPVHICWLKRSSSSIQMPNPLDPIDNGFYYDFYMDPISDEDLRTIEKRMKELVKANLAVEREEHDNATLRSMFADNPFKIEIMDDKIGEGSGSSVYRQGDFVDLCRGPHVPTTAMLRWFKLTSTSTSYWKADSSRESLVRIYGWCFANKQDLQNHETMMQKPPSEIIESWAKICNSSTSMRWWGRASFSGHRVAQSSEMNCRILFPVIYADKATIKSTHHILVNSICIEPVAITPTTKRASIHLWLNVT